MPPPSSSSSSSKSSPLPLAPNRASIANEISLLLSRRTALLKTLNPTPLTSSASSTSPSTSSRKHAPNADAIEQLFSGPRPNQGVGYVPERNDAAASTQDQTLRRKLLGKNYKNGKNGGGVMKGRGGAESESDEEEGRSALGKRKRKRSMREEAEEQSNEGEGENGKVDGAGERHAEEGEGGKGEEGRRDEEEEEEEEGKSVHDNGDDAAPVKEKAAVSDNAADEAKRNKKKRKRQREKEKQRQKREQK
ncbi:hypothetical protein CCMA1212_003376 [Trichoderma ghanense]|uniref:Uncharacterized protein n=1 Tax=Trichoderma ghanense TaxID=65468 RepID=A0ABY2H8N2_9HYPO